MFNPKDKVIKYAEVSGKKRQEFEIHEIPKKDLSSYKLLGTAEGIHVNHCVYLGKKYSEDFSKKVAGYRLETPKQKGCLVAVSFYEKKKKK